MSKPLLALDNVAHFYGSRLVFKDISLSLQPGVHIMAGANGAGKTTLLSLMAGLAKPTMGTVQWGENCSISLVGHKTFLYPELTALENLQFWSNLHGQKLGEKQYLEALERVSLAAFKDEKSGTFSRGMAQRLSLARVLLQKPTLMLLDEPGTGLDTFSMEVLHSEIAAAKTRGACLVWISHTLATDMAHADTVLFIQNKRLAYAGPAASFVPEVTS